jgi:hypothetical protein
VKFEELPPNPPLLVLSAFSPIPLLMTKHDFEVKCYESKKTIQTFVDGGTYVLWIQWILGSPNIPQYEKARNQTIQLQNYVSLWP